MVLHRSVEPALVFGNFSHSLQTDPLPGIFSRRHEYLTGHVENGVCGGLLLYQPDGLTGRHDDQFDVAAFCLAFHFLHHRQTAVRAGADHKLVAFPGYLFFDGQGRMPKLVTESLGRRLVAFANLTAVDHHVLLVRAAVDSEGTEGKFVEVHARLLVLLCSGALLRGDGREGRPALFYLVTAAVRAGSLFRVMLRDGQNRQEGFLAGVADELIMGHTDLPSL